MAITTYSELQAAAAAWLVRRDLTARIPEFISLAEAMLNRQVRKRQAETTQSLTATPASRTIALPAAFAEPLNLWIVINGQRIPRQFFVDPALMQTYADAGEPRQWTIDGATLAFERPCDQAYGFALRMLGKYALSDASPTNDLLSDAPDVYLYAVLAEAGPFLRDADIAQAYTTKRDQAIADLNAKDARSRAPQTLVTEIAAMTGRRGRGYDIRSDR